MEKESLKNIDGTEYFELTGALSALQWLLDEMGCPFPNYRRPE